MHFRQRPVWWSLKIQHNRLKLQSTHHTQNAHNNLATLVEPQVKAPSPLLWALTTQTTQQFYFINIFIRKMLHYYCSRLFACRIFCKYLLASSKFWKKAFWTAGTRKWDGSVEGSCAVNEWKVSEREWDRKIHYTHHTNEVRKKGVLM